MEYKRGDPIRLSVRRISSQAGIVEHNAKGTYLAPDEIYGHRVVFGDMQPIGVKDEEIEPAS